MESDQDEDDDTQLEDEGEIEEDFFDDPYFLDTVITSTSQVAFDVQGGAGIMFN